MTRPVIKRRGQAGRYCERERARHAVGFGAHVGANHVERPVRQIDDVHDAEDKRQTRCHQEQHHAELQSIECLNEQKQHVGTRPAGASNLAARSFLRHVTFRSVGIFVILEDRLLLLQKFLAVFRLLNLKEIEIFDREVICVEGEVSTNRREIGSL